MEDHGAVKMPAMPKMPEHMPADMQKKMPMPKMPPEPPPAKP